MTRSPHAHVCMSVARRSKTCDDTSHKKFVGQDVHQTDKLLCSAERQKDSNKRCTCNQTKHRMTSWGRFCSHRMTCMGHLLYCRTPWSTPQRALMCCARLACCTCAQVLRSVRMHCSRHVYNAFAMSSSHQACINCLWVCQSIAAHRCKPTRHRMGMCNASCSVCSTTMRCCDAGDNDCAEVTLSEAASVQPRHPKAILALGSVLQDAGNHDGALIQYQTAAHIHPESPQVSFIC